MTLLTQIAIIQPTPVRAVFDECRRLIGAQDATYEHEVPGRFYHDGRAVYRNHVGQGLPALLSISYSVDSPLMPDDESEYPEDERSTYPSSGGWSIEVNFDTAYGYRERNGASCDDLHAWLVQQLGQWLDDRGLTWLWCEEYTGEWHPSSTPVTKLGNPERGRLPS